jgi:hypothetical protein
MKTKLMMTAMTMLLFMVSVISAQAQVPTEVETKEDALKVLKFYSEKSNAKAPFDTEYGIYVFSGYDDGSFNIMLCAPHENFQEMKEHTDVVKSTLIKYIKKDKTLRGLVANVLIAEADFMVIYVDQKTRDVNDKIVVTFSNEELQKIFEAGEEEEE